MITIDVLETGYVMILKDGMSIMVDMYDELDGLHSRLEAVIYERDAMADYFTDYQSADATDPFWDNFDDWDKMYYDSFDEEPF